MADTRERPPPIEEALGLRDVADVAHSPSLAGIKHLVDHLVQPNSAPRRRP